MATEVKMPQLGLTMTEGTIGSWLKKVGDKVAVGDVLAEIQTDKLTTEITSEYEGEMLAIVAQEGEDVPVQGVICVIGAPGEKVDAPAAAAPAAEAAPASAPAAQAAPAAAVATVERASGERVRISPLAKKIARENNIDYSNIAGSGPGGRIVQKDVMAAKASGAGAAPAASSAGGAAAAAMPVMPGDRREKMSSMRKVVAERMLKSHTEIPVVTQNVKVDMTSLMAFRQKLNENREVRFSVNDLVLKAVAKALAANKYMLTSIEGNEIVHHEQVNIGMAVALDSGLIVPVIKEADKLSLGALAEKAKDLASRARSGGLEMDEYQGSTFSVSNLGMFQVEAFTPIINQPNAAILGVCSIDDELALVNGEVKVRKVMRICLTYDHRLMDGAQAARFQLAVKELLENPMEILL